MPVLQIETSILSFAPLCYIYEVSTAGILPIYISHLRGEHEESDDEDWNLKPEAREVSLTFVSAVFERIGLSICIS